MPDLRRVGSEGEGGLTANTQPSNLNPDTVIGGDNFIMDASDVRHACMCSRYLNALPV